MKVLGLRREKYKHARKRLLRELEALGWKTQPDEKVPYAASKGSEFRIWLGTESAYFTRGVHAFKHASLLFADIRDLPVTFLIGHVMCAAVHEQRMMS